ncbi:peptide chain release factor N(5)-glutamine methyltransferase [Methylomarinum sp. Ch1-1]|uniref:Release factor glutamine methyltransferase n=1 Tax=Methylomarinum roseum TaxID=3067653 RepID=A0AAU7NV63_9GAMM
MTDADIQSLLVAAEEKLAAVSDSPLLDAEILLCLCLNKPRTFLRAWPEKRLDQAALAAFQTALAQRLQGLPIAYITGSREFWSREFKVSPEVLIPRPDTELLIELSLRLMPADRAIKLIDLGTGSGIIAVTLAAERPLAQVTATDRSAAALKIAKDNAQRHRVDNIRFVESDWFSAITDSDFDLVISNPPYIAAEDPHLDRGDVRHEPDEALIAAEQGLRDIRILAEQASQHLNACGHLLLEHGYNQQQAVQAIFKTCHYQQVSTAADLSGNPRVTTGIWNP